MTSITPRTKDAETSRAGHEDALARMEREMGFDATEVRSALNAIWRCSISEAEYSPLRLDKSEQGLADLAALPTTERIEEIAALAEAAMAISTPAVAKREIARLIGAFPNASPANPEVYISALVFDVLDLGISDAVLVLACRNIRRTQKFVPAVAEVIAAAEKVAERWRSLRELAKVRRVVESDLRRIRAEAQFREKAETERAARRIGRDTASPETVKAAEPPPVAVAVRFPTLVEVWRNNAEMMEVLGRADFDTQCGASGLLATKGEPAARAFLTRKLMGKQ